MIFKKVFKLFTVFGVVLLLLGFLALLPLWSSPASAQGVAAQTSVGTGFNYQGHLLQAGTAVTGTCDLTFKLYDTPTGLNQVGSDVIDNNVSINDGYFSVNLDFGSTAFTGQTRWLEITINSCNGNGISAALIPLVELNPTPYALSLRPGAVISGSMTPALTAQTDSNDTNASGVYGLATANSSVTFGVIGQSNSNENFASGVFGFAAANSGATNGVLGQASSTQGVGVLGTSPTTGTVGIASATSGTTYGVYGKTNSTSEGAGVYGQTLTPVMSIPPGTAGVLGNSNGSTGVLGVSNSGTGVYAVSGGGTALAAYSYSGPGLIVTSQIGDPLVVFNDTDVTFKVDSQGLITWKTITSYLSISPGDFQPAEDGYDYQNSSYKLQPNDTASLNYVAGAQLPHGATVTRFTFYWRDDDSSGGPTGSATLCRGYLMSEGYSVMAETQTSSNTGMGSDTDTTIGVNTIDNSQYTYYVDLTLPNSNVKVYGVIIEYTFTQPY